MTISTSCVFAHFKSMSRVSRILAKQCHRNCFQFTVKNGYFARYLSSNRQSEGSMNVFDRKAKRIQRNRSAADPDYALYEYLREEVSIFKKIPMISKW